MLPHMIVILAAFGWGVHVLAAPADLNRVNHIADDEDNSLYRYTLPHFSAASSDVDVNKTIEQVQEILAANPLLPRLSKEEILQLLNNITEEDKLKEKEEYNSTPIPTFAPPFYKSQKDKDGKPIMVVLPYHPKDTENVDITELYTRPPIIRFITPRPIVVLDETMNADSSERQEIQEQKNHNYQDITSASTSHFEPVQNSFWQDQAQKATNEEKKKSEKKETNELAFKKMPNIKIPHDFDKKSVQTENFSDSGVSDDMKDFLSSMGLYNIKGGPIVAPLTDLELITPNEDAVVRFVNSPSSFNFNDQVPQESISSLPDASVYDDFKPLPFDGINNEQKNVTNLDEILERFGILEMVNKEYLPLNDFSQTKSVDFLSNTDFIDPEMFPAGMTDMLTDLGLTKKGREMSYTYNSNGMNEYENTENQGSTSSEVLKSGPDPMSTEELNLGSSQETIDMIKRQEPNDTTVTTTEANTETKTESSDDSKSLENNEGPALADLESSFGGSPADDDPSEAELPPPRKNGFYYMLDWNSFLEVGEGDTKVNIRFDPKLGDPQRFLPVTVP